MTQPQQSSRTAAAWANAYKKMTKFFPPVHPIAFAEAMDRHWTNLSNQSSPTLFECWLEQGKAYGHQIFNHANEDAPNKRTEWIVLNPPTGSGKTEGMMLFCTMMAKVRAEDHPGALLVTRTIEAADLIAKRINKDSERPGYALSFHSKNSDGIERNTLANYPVLVITHAAYETALRQLKDQQAFNQTWPSFYAWQESGRRLVIIDEAPTLLEHTQAELEGLRRTLSIVPQPLRLKYADEVKALIDFIDILVTQAAQDQCTECAIPRYIGETGRLNMSGLIHALKNIAFNEDLGDEYASANHKLYKTHRDRLLQVQELATKDMYYARVMGKHTLNSSSLIVPEDMKGAIILDATASVNVMYELFDKAKITIMPKRIRKYQKVTLYVNRGQNVGKTCLKNDTDSVLYPVIADLNNRLNGHNIFFATHKGIKAKVEAAPTQFKKSIGTWGSIDGSNKWKDYDTAVIFGLPTKPDTWSANTVNGFQGMQTTEWLQGPERPFGIHGDVRRALKTGDTVTQVIQAINRIRCRKVIDADGNCPEAEVYLLLPDGSTGDEILQGIIGVMEGIQVKPWVVDGFQAKETKRGRPSGKGTAVQPLIDFLFTMPTGKVSKEYIIESTEVSTATFKRFVAETKKEGSTTWQFLNDLSITYVSGKGKNAETYFNKVK